MANFPECLKCDCTFSSGCQRLAADGKPKKRKYVMTKPRPTYRGCDKTKNRKAIEKLKARADEYAAKNKK